MKTIVAVACALALALAACTGEEPAPRATGSPEEPPSVTLDARGVPLFDGPENAPRFGIEAAKRAANVIVTAYRASDRAVDIRERRAPQGIRISLCPLESIDARVTLDDRCRSDIGLGVREPVSSRRFAGFAVVAAGVGGTGDDLLADIVIQYAEAARSVSILMPIVRGPRGGMDCSDNGCNPFFELRPTMDGRLTATATWDGPQATLVLLQGSVLGRSQTATGIPYREAASDTGRGRVAIGAPMSAPGEYALAIRHQRLRPGEPPLRNVRIDALWP